MSGAEFDSFVQQAQLILSGPPLDRQFLAGLWDGADKDPPASFRWRWRTPLTASFI